MPRGDLLVEKAFNSDSVKRHCIVCRGQNPPVVSWLVVWVVSEATGQTLAKEEQGYKTFYKTSKKYVKNSHNESDF